MWQPGASAATVTRLEGADAATCTTSFSRTLSRLRTYWIILDQSGESDIHIEMLAGYAHTATR